MFLCVNVALETVQRSQYKSLVNVSKLIHCSDSCRHPPNEAYTSTSAELADTLRLLWDSWPCSHSLPAATVLASIEREQFCAYSNIFARCVVFTPIS